MARLSILDRFRPVGAPGPAGPAGVPADDDQGRAAELAPVLAALAGDVAACEALVAEARLSADGDVTRARAQAAAIVARARLDAGAAGVRAAARIEREGSERDLQLVEQAHQEAATLEKAGLARIPAVVSEVIDNLLAPQGGELQ